MVVCTTQVGLREEARRGEDATAIQLYSVSRASECKRRFVGWFGFGRASKAAAVRSGQVWSRLLWLQLCSSAPHVDRQLGRQAQFTASLRYQRIF